MVYRDDRDALIERAAALERERDVARREAEALREENDRLRAAAPEVELPAASPAPAAVAVRPRARRARRWRGPARIVGVTVAVGVTLVVTSGAPIAWVAAVGAFTAEAVRWVLRRRRRSLPVDHDAYRALLAEWGPARPVRLEVRFARVPDRTERDRLRQDANRHGLRAEWDGEQLVVFSKKLRGRDEATAFCDAALSWIADRRGVAAVVPRAGGPRAARSRYASNLPSRRRRR